MPWLHAQNPFSHCQIRVTLSEDILTKIDFYPCGACWLLIPYIESRPSARAPAGRNGWKPSQGPIPQANPEVGPPPPGSTRERGWAESCCGPRARVGDAASMGHVGFVSTSHLPWPDGRWGGASQGRHSHCASQAGLCPFVASVVWEKFTEHPPHAQRRFTLGQGAQLWAGRAKTAQ